MKTLLAFFGLIFFALITILGIALVISYFDLTGSPGILQDLLQTRFQLPNLPNLTMPDSRIQVTVVGRGSIERQNPLDAQPLPIVSTLEVATLEMPTFETPTEIPTPVPTVTPIPTVDPEVYQTDAIIRLKRYARVLEDFLAANDEVMQDGSLLKDPAWREKMKTSLAEVADAGHSLATIGIPPEEYARMDAWFVKIGEESVHLQANYLRALQTGSSQDFTNAGENFQRIKEYLSQAAKLMISAGWKVN